MGPLFPEYINKTQKEFSCRLIFLLIRARLFDALLQNAQKFLMNDLADAGLSRMHFCLDGCHQGGSIYSSTSVAQSRSLYWLEITAPFASLE